MNTPAQRPPEALSTVERLGKATAELVLLSLAAFVGMSVVAVLTLLSILPADQAWSAIAAGPILLGISGASYVVLERALASGEARPLELPEGRRRAGFLAGVLIAFGAVLAAMIGSTVLALAQEAVLSIEVEEQRTILELVERGDPLDLTLLAVSAVILAPITEELLFRGMFFRRLRQQAGAVAAWTLPALAFAVAHWNPVGLLVYVWLGSVFAGAYVLSGRLWVAMLAHAGHNAFALTMLLYAPDVLP